MNLCSHFHDEVCYETAKCPVCETIKEKDKEIDALNDAIGRLVADNKELEKLTHEPS